MTPAPIYRLRDGLDETGHALASSLAAMLKRREEFVRHAAALLARHHDAYLHGRGEQGPPPDDETCERELGHPVDEIEIYATWKVFDTPRGRIEDMRSLFQHPPAPPLPELELVKDTLRALVAAEDAGAPLSDDALLDAIHAALADREIVIGRVPGEDHPIAQLRRGLGIPAPDDWRRE